MSYPYIQAVGPEKPIRINYGQGTSHRNASEAEYSLECYRGIGCDYDHYINGQLVAQRRNGKIADASQ